MLKERDYMIVDSKEVCEIFTDYFANIASSIGWVVAIVDVVDAVQNIIATPVLYRSKRYLLCLKNLFFNQYKIATFDFKKEHRVIISQAKSKAWPTTSWQIRWYLYSNESYVSQPSYKKSEYLRKWSYKPVSVLATWSKLNQSTINDQLFSQFVSFIHGQ